MKITKPNLILFRTKFANTVINLEKELGIKIDLGSITFDANSFKGKIEVTNIGSNLADVARIKFENNAFLCGFKKTDYNRVVDIYGKTYRLVGLKPQNTKYPCIVENDEGSYKMTVQMVQGRLV